MGHEHHTGQSKCLQSSLAAGTCGDHSVPGHVTEQGDTRTLAKIQQLLLQEGWLFLGKEGAS